jgi:DNA polymerase III subunit alpha
VVRINSFRSLGTQSVYDIGVEQDHNFMLANGLVASNCFNKAHSAAYGLITYQTAYLKAHYPVEYLAALLSSIRGDQEKVQRYLAACQGMGIYVLPPDINRSGPDFTPEGKTILFGLAAVKNAGDAAVESLIKMRDEDGLFTSFSDLCDRIDSRVVNKRALEALIRCGALDTLHPNRNQMLSDLDLTLEWSIRRARDRASGQVNLFDSLLSGTSTPEQVFDSAPKGPIVEDLLPQDKLKMEKELLGFYVSDHPLKSIRQVAKILAPINLIDLPDYREEASVSAIVLVTEVKVVTTKKGDRMAIIQLEDLTGSASAVLFPKAYERLSEVFQLDARLMVWAKIDRKEDQPQLILNDAEPIEHVRMILVELSSDQAREIQVQHRLRELLGSQAPEKKEELGLVPVIARIGYGGEHRFVRFGPQFRVKNAEATVALLNQSGFSAHTQAVAPTAG